MRKIQLILTFLFLLAYSGVNAQHNLKFNTRIFGPSKDYVIQHPDTSNIVFGLPCVRYSSLNGFGLELIAGHAFGQINGANISGIYNIARGGVNGFNLAGFSTYAQQYMSGASVAGGFNVLYGDMNGFKLAGIANFNIGNAQGFQLAGITNFNAENLYGLQLSALTNVNGGTLKGAQVSGFLNVSMGNMNGFQIGITNYARRVKGFQLGAINVSGRSVHGLQLGAINYAYDTAQIQLGLINMNPKTKITGIIYGGTMTAINFGIRFRNKYTFSVLAIGYPYDDSLAEFSGAFSYRKGVYYDFKRFTFSADLGYSHINLVSSKEHEEKVPDALWSVQARGNIGFRICKYIGVFASGGYEYTARYGTFACFRREPIFEFGVSLF
ncbi:MAG: LA_2272 family surface repeat-containing protein [Bacteroidales bacterium]